MIFRKHNHCNGSICYHEKRYFGIRVSHWKMISVLLTVLFLTGVVYLFLRSSYDYEVMLRKPVSLIYPIRMNAYAEEVDAGHSAEPKFPLADLSEREKNIALIKNIFGRDSETAIRVFTCESGLRSKAENDHNYDGFPDIGIAQIHVTSQSLFTVSEMFDAYANLLQAKRMFDSRGWQPWESSNPCHHALK